MILYLLKNLIESYGQTFLEFEHYLALSLILAVADGLYKASLLAPAVHMKKRGATARIEGRPLLDFAGSLNHL